MWLIGVANQIARFVAFIVLTKHLEAKIHCFFAISDTWLLTEILRSDDFCVDDNNDNNKTDCFTPCACAG